MSVLRTLLRASAFVAVAFAGLAHAQTTLTVTTTDMTFAVDGQCSLPEAFQAANTNATVNECVVGAGGEPFTIILGTNQTYVATAGVPDATVGPTAAIATVNVEIVGNGSTIRRDAAAPAFRLFAATTPGKALTLRDLVLDNGAATDAVAVLGQYGGAVIGTGVLLQLDRVRVGGSTGGNASAVAAVSGILNVHRSSFVGNTGPVTLFVTDPTAVFNMANSTLDGNTTPGGGDVFVNGADAVNLRHNTIFGMVQIDNVTGVSDFTGNLLGTGCASTGSPLLTAGPNAAPAGTCPVATISDLTSVQPLGVYGGATLTRAIKLPSALADGNPDCTYRSSGSINSLFTNATPITVDQRGFARPAGACDIGAFEAARFTPNTLPDAVVNQAYDSGAIQVDGSVPFTGLTASGLPSGLAAVGNPALGQFNVTGTPTATGTFTPTFTTQDNAGMVALHDMALRVIAPPGAPAITSTSLGNGQATIGFTAPGSDGGSPITGYRVKCNAGAFTSASSLTSPITITLPNGGTYDCQVYATNAAGEGPASNNTNFSLAATTVSSILNSDANPNPGPSVRFAVTFSRAVTGVDTGDFTLTTTGVTGASITGVTGSGTDYLVTVATGTGSGTIRLDVVDNDTITDGSAPLGGTGAGNGNFTTGVVYNITAIPGAPTITSITPGNGQATIAFTAPASDGGSPITGYRASCTPGPVVSASSATSPITIALANGATYSCVVIATNANGDGPPSAAQGVTLPATTVASIVRASANPNGGPSVGFTVTFSRAVTGVDAADFALTTTGVTGASITGVSGSGTTYTVTVATGTGQGTIRLDVVDNDTITDGSAPLGGTGAGNGNFTSGQVYTITSVPGAPTITSATPGSGQATIAFTAPASDGGSPITGYRVSCTPGPVVSASSATSPITITLANGTTYSCVVIATNANGDGPPSAPASVALGVTSVVSIVRAAANPTGAASVTFTVTFSQPVTGVDAADFALNATGLTGAAVTGVSGSGTTYTVTVATGTGSGTLRLDLVDNDSINDGSAPLGGAGAGNGNFSSGESYTVDRTAPTVVSSNRVGAATVSGGAPQQFTVTFSEAVTGVDAADFVVTATGTAAATVTGVTGSGTTYTVTVNITTGGASGGTVRLDLNDNDSIVDALGNTLGGTGAGNGNFTTGQSYTVSSATTTTFSGSSATGSGTITVVVTGGGATCTLQNPQFIPVEGHPRSPPAGSAPAGVVFPHGLFDFSLINCTPGSTVTLVITYPSSVVGLQYYKYGPTPGNTTPHWYVMPATAAANTMTFSITDGGLGDDDLTANGTIVDQGGPGTGTPGSAEPIPTMSEWMMILMGLMLFGMAASRLRMRR